MRSFARGAPHWCSEVALGLYRSLVLVALTLSVPVVALPVGYFGWRLASSWTMHWHGLVVLRVLATVGEMLVVIMWIATAAWTLHVLTSRTLVHAARHAARRWLGLELAVAYKPPAPVVRMATGFWWDGREYHKSEREAQRRARMNARFHDPQLHWDGVWRLVASVTVLPVAAVPLIAVAEGAYLLRTPSLLPYGVAAIVGGLALAPFAWRILGPSATRFLGPVPSSSLSRRVTELETLRADQTQAQVAELERIERGLHDGAQARLVAMGMAIQASERLIDTDPDRAKAVLADARAASKTALTELRALVRGINPPVLAERGLVDAVRALALDAPLHVSVHSRVPARPERPVESAAYFAIAELLANATKHARASEVTIELDYHERMLTVSVTDNGVGGAAATAGSGLSGIERRMKAFDGRVKIDSPAGGPTRVTVAVPCALS
jgi:signal transduction histidine kinase